MNFNHLFEFLEELQKNNHKDWMDAHRVRYHNIRDDYLKWLMQLDVELSEIDSDYYPTPKKKILNRINNNLLYHPNKPVYKDHFGAGLDKRPNTSDFYIHIGINESFLGGGFYTPKSPTLKSIREAIDYNGEVLKAILNKPSFKNTFGEMMDDDMLKTSPKGYTQDHEHIDLLRYKSFAVTYDLTQSDVLNKDFKNKIKKVYLEMLPFRRYLNKAVSV
ncbi:DUF2461 domain-containing protein [Mesohalobacter halotolerans]|uniref:DUF2461 domain-containing protein n=1 Tax=Mesohalobacter halotolerans TaxID=1883405 RepID=A0A4U5TUT7_9FLAO|nr:DUF2461 domain-containing protein [Mesohalobacter halotolerans]MBS3737468.1 DUF2461 domain-containing protein [Psychroflexus sp.]TKS57048.1 DUF2461 domain-containing protein [Mesohalobacter halotolerans]